MIFTSEWSNVIIGVKMYNVACSHINLSEECMHDVLPGSKPIIQDSS